MSCPINLNKIDYKHGYRTVTFSTTNPILHIFVKTKAFFLIFSKKILKKLVIDIKLFFLWINGEIKKLHDRRSGMNTAFIETFFIFSFYFLFIFYKSVLCKGFFLMWQTENHWSLKKSYFFSVSIYLETELYKS